MRSGLEGTRPAALVAVMILLGVAIAIAIAIAITIAATPIVAETEGGDTDLIIPRPDLSAMDQAPRSKVERMQQRLTELSDLTTAQRSGDTPVELTDGFGHLGQLFHAFRLLDAAEVCYGNSQRLAPGDYRWPHYLGLVRNAKGDLDRATTDYLRALEIRPDDFPTLIRLGNALLELGRADEAEPRFRRALEIESESAVAYFGLAKAAALRGDQETAVEYFEKTRALQPEASVVHYPLAQVYRKLGDLEAARRHLSQRGDEEVRFSDPLGNQVVRLAKATAFEIVLSLARNSESVPEEEFLGFALSQFGDIKGTIDQLEHGLLLERYSGGPGDPLELARIHYVLGGLLVNDERDEDAIAHYRRAIELDPTLIDTRIKLGNALARQQRFDQAMQAYSAVLGTQPENTAALLKQAAVLMNLGEDAEARPLLEQLVLLEPGNSEALVRLASLHERAGEIGRAIELYRTAASLDLRLPETVQIRYLLASILMRRGATDEALTEFRWILEADPDFLPAQASMAGLLGRLGRFDEAATLYGGWAAKEPEKIEARVGEVTALVAAGRHHEARRRLEAGLAALPDNLALKDILARHLSACPDLSVREGPRALELALEVYEAVPSVESVETMAMAYAQAGRFEDAVVWQQRLVEQAVAEGNETSLARLRANLERYRAGLVCCAPAP